MDVKEIKSAVSSLDKSKDDVTVLKLLNILNDGVVPSESLLRETKVGVAVNKFRTSSNPEIQSLVKKMIRKWRELVQNEKTKKKSSVSASDNNKSAEKVAEQTNSVAKAPPKENKFHSGPRNPKTDGIDTNIYENSTRNASVSALYTALAIERDDSSEHIVAVAKDIENEVYRSEKLSISDLYRTKLRTFTMNLRNKKNPDLRDRLLSGKISPEAFIKMSPNDMAPEALKKEIEKLHKQNLFEAQGATEKRAVTDRFTCGKCKHKKVSYYQMQTRSADEPLTTFCTCENCGNRWKFS